MRRLTAALTLLCLFSGQAVADLDSEISRTCGDMEPVISMAQPNDTYSNPGPPNMYEWQVCVEGIKESVIDNSCERTTGFYLSSEQETAHFSAYSNYDRHVCTGQMETRTSTEDPRVNETLLFTASNRSGGHVAGQNVFEYNVYGSYVSPENVTVSMDFNLSSSDDVYFDGEKIDGKQSFSPPTSFPYLVSDSSSLTSGILASEFLRSERSIENTNNLEITASSEASSFYIPLFSGNVQDIDSRQEMILGNEFMTQISPSFGSTIPESPSVRAIYSPEINLESELNLYSGNYQFNITKTGEEQASLER